MFIERRDIHTIELYANNPRRSDKAVPDEQSGRRVFRMEIDPLYGDRDVIVQRWEPFANTKTQCVAAIENGCASRQPRRDREG